MGQKVHPTGFRLGITKYWNSKWFEEKNYAKWLHEDLKIKEFLQKKLGDQGISKVEIKRTANRVPVKVYTAKPGSVIGKNGENIERLKAGIQKFTDSEVFLSVQGVAKPDLDAQLVAQGIALQLERRVSFRRAMKKAVQTAMRLGAEGIRVNCSGRLGGAEMSRREWYLEGRVPLHTLRADIDYGFAEALTTYGIIGVKVWIFKGEILEIDMHAN